MKKLLVLMVVLALSSMANATLLTWSVGSVEVAPGGTITVQLLADDNLAYPDVWVGADLNGVAEILSVVEVANNAGDSSLILDPVATAYDGWWTVAAADMTEPFNSIVAGAQFDVTFKALGVGSVDFYAGDEVITVIVPEPATIALLCLGGLLLRKK